MPYIHPHPHRAFNTMLESRPRGTQEFAVFEVTWHSRDWRAANAIDMCNASVSNEPCDFQFYHTALSYGSSPSLVFLRIRFCMLASM